jgi:ribonuclease VapC
MVIDSSALIALLQSEPEADRILEALVQFEERHISAATVLEASIVLAARFGESADKELDILLHKADIETVSLTSEQTELAREAWKRFGKGRHAAALNFGDCFSYALAKSLGAPLLFVGDDFGKTDITPA